jgi:transposase-like protein
MDVHDEACTSGDNSRDGQRKRKFTITVRTPNLKIFKLHLGSYFPEDILERYSCTDKAIIAVIAVGKDGIFRFVGMDVVNTESYDFWSKFWSNCNSVVSDTHDGPKRAIAKTFLEATWQRCIVHLERNVAKLMTD